MINAIIGAIIYFNTDRCIGGRNITEGEIYHNTMSRVKADTT